MRLTPAILFALLPAIVATPIETRNGLAPLSVTGESIPDSYIIVFKKGVSPDQIALHLDSVAGFAAASPLRGDSSGINHVWGKDTSLVGDSVQFAGYSGQFSAEALAQIRASPEVAYVEQDQTVHTQEVVHGVDDAFATSGDIVDQKGAPWGLARISHRPRLTLGTFNKYIYDKHGGEGVTAYVIDTGVNIEHVEFQGRARWGKTIPKNDQDIDGNGHGTHCAGTIASRKYGVAKAAEIVAVKVLGTNGSGTMSDVIDGVLWAAEDAIKNAKAQAGTSAARKGSVANMSLGGGKAKSLDEAVDAAVESGLHFAVAAGNDNKDACDYSPAASVGAVTVGASTITDDRAYFSNYGKCVDIFAPGLNILSTWNRSPTDTNTISGTSMASPHICGLLAYLLSIEGSETFPESAYLESTSDEAHVEMMDEPSLYAQAYNLFPAVVKGLLPEPEKVPVISSPEATKGKKITPKQLKKALIALSTPGKLSDTGAGSPNLLAFNNATA